MRNWFFSRNRRIKSSWAICSHYFSKVKLKITSCSKFGVALTFEKFEQAHEQLMSNIRGPGGRTSGAARSYINKSIYLSIYLYMYVYIRYIYLYIYIYIYIYIYVYVYICRCIYVCRCFTSLDIYIHTYMYIHMYFVAFSLMYLHTHICRYMWIHICMSLRFSFWHHFLVRIFFLEAVHEQCLMVRWHNNWSC